MTGWKTGVLAIAAAIGALHAAPAGASDAVCAAPEGSAEQALCDDPYLMGLNLQVTNVLWNFIGGRADELPEWRDMEHGHYWIAMEECDGAFRCLEDVISQYLDQLTEEYLAGDGAALAAHRDVRFMRFQSQDSPGNDLLPWDSPENFGWSERLCALRCAAHAGCVAAGFDPMQALGADSGYCTLKGSATFPLSDWSEQGVLMIRQ